VKSWNSVKLAAYFLFLILPISCAALPPEKPSADVPTPSTGKDLETQEATADQSWVIFSAEQAEKIEIGSWLIESDGYWTLSDDDILKIEENIAEYLSQNSDKFFLAAGSLAAAG
jgi:hypothetical protein